MEEQMITMPSEQDLKSIQNYLGEKNFSDIQTNEEITGLFLVLIGYGVEPKKALKNIIAVVTALQKEYDEQ